MTGLVAERLVLTPLDDSELAAESMNRVLWHLENSIRVMTFHENERPFRPRKHRTAQLIAIKMSERLSEMCGVSAEDIRSAYNLNTQFPFRPT